MGVNRRRHCPATPHGGAQPEHEPGRMEPPRGGGVHPCGGLGRGPLLLQARGLVHARHHGVTAREDRRPRGTRHQLGASTHGVVLVRARPTDGPRLLPHHQRRLQRQRTGWRVLGPGSRAPAARGGEETARQPGPGLADRHHRHLRLGDRHRRNGGGVPERRTPGHSAHRERGPGRSGCGRLRHLPGVGVRGGVHQPDGSDPRAGVEATGRGLVARLQPDPGQRRLGRNDSSTPSEGLRRHHVHGPAVRAAGPPRGGGGTLLLPRPGERPTAHQRFGRRGHLPTVALRGPHRRAHPGGEVADRRRRRDAGRRRRCRIREVGHAGHGAGSHHRRTARRAASPQTRDLAR